MAGQLLERGVRRLAYSKAEVAEALGVSVDYVEDHVWSELRLVRRGRKTLCPVRELEAWLDRSAARVLESGAARSGRDRDRTDSYASGTRG